MPQTVPMGFEFEALTEQPTRTLNGGSDGLSPILAEQANDAFVDVLADVADIEARLAAAEAAVAASKWRDLGGGVETGAAFSIPVPAGFEMLQLYLLGDLSGDGSVRLRINGDTTSALHRTGLLVYDALGNLDDTVFFDATTWYLASWATVSGNLATSTIYGLNVAGGPGYHSTGAQHSAGDTGHRVSHGWGQLNAERLVSSLQVLPFDDVSNQFATVHWRLDGRLA